MPFPCDTEPYLATTNRAKAQSDRKQFWRDASKRGADGAEEGGGEDEGEAGGGAEVDAPDAEGGQGQLEAKDDATDNSTDGLDGVVEAETKAVAALVREHPRFGVSYGSTHRRELGVRTHQPPSHRTTYPSLAPHYLPHYTTLTPPLLLSLPVLPRHLPPLLSSLPSLARLCSPSTAPV